MTDTTTAKPVAEEYLDYRPVSEIKPNPNNPRKTFDEKKLEELMQSIVEEGQLQPIRIRDDGTLIAGERRTRAVKLGIKKKLLPADFEMSCIIIHGADETKTDLDALIENLQRVDLNPLEEAHALLRVVERGMTQAELARRVGRSTAHVSKRLGLLRLDPEVQDLLVKGKVTIEQATALASIESPAQQRMLAKVEGYLRDQEIADALARQKLEKVVKKVTAELKALGIDKVTKQYPYNGTCEKLGQEIDATEFKGSIPKGANLAYFALNTYSGTVRLTFFKQVEAKEAKAKEASTEGANTNAGEMTPAQKKELEKRRREQAERLALERARAQARKDVLAGALKKPKKADVLAWVLDAFLDEDVVVFDHGEDIVEALGLEVWVEPEDEGGERMRDYDAEAEKVSTMLREGSELDKLRIALVILADKRDWDNDGHLRFPILEALGYDESKVKVGA